MLTSNNPNKMGIGKALVWAALTIGGCIIAFFSTAWIGIIDDVDPPSYILGLFIGGTLGGAVSGLVVGLFERAFLPKWLSLRRIWIWASVAGWALGIGVLWLLESVNIVLFTRNTGFHLDPLTSAIVGNIGYALVGLSLFAVQGLFIRARANHAVSWVLRSSLGWVVGFIVASLAFAFLVALGIKMEVAISVIILAPGIAGFVEALSFNVLTPREDKLQTEAT